MTNPNPGLPVPEQRGFVMVNKVLHYAVRMSNGEVWRSDVPARRFWDAPEHLRPHNARKADDQRWTKAFSPAIAASFVPHSWEPVMVSTPLDPPGFHVYLHGLLRPGR